MHEIRFLPLRIEEGRVHVEWTVEPSTLLYNQTCFTLDFHNALDARSLPPGLLWTAVILCLHSHWNLLRPCRVELPVEIPASEIEFWQRRLDYERTSLEVRKGTSDFERTVEIVGEGPSVGPVPLATAEERYATAFSGGKESLTQAALLSEFTRRPLLVNTQSEMPPMRDHTTRRRALVLSEITKRRECELVIVNTDMRANWENQFPRSLGYEIHVNELCDVNLYIANLLLVAYARGVRACAIGLEFENQSSGQPYSWTYVYHYVPTSPIAISSLNHLLNRWGITLGSLLFPLTSFQIERVLWQRYRDLADLQNSCFSVENSEQAYCSKCIKCHKAGLALLSFGLGPAMIGIDVSTLFKIRTGLEPTAPPTAAGATVYAGQRIDLQKVRRFFPAENWKQHIGLEEPPAFRSLRLFVERSRNMNQDWVGQFRPQFLKYIPESLRPKLAPVFQQYAGELDPTDRTAEIALIDDAIDWITEPLRT